MSTAPVRVNRAGWTKLTPLTRDQVRKACLYAEAWVRPTTWKDATDLMHALAWCVIDQLNRPVKVVVAGMHDIDDMPVMRLHVGEIVHHIAVRDTRMVHNTTAELMLADEDGEILLTERIAAAKERSGVKDKLQEKVLDGKARR